MDRLQQLYANLSQTFRPYIGLAIVLIVTAIIVQTIGFFIYMSTPLEDGDTEPLVESVLRNVPKQGPPMTHQEQTEAILDILGQQRRRQFGSSLIWTGLAVIAGYIVAVVLKARH